MQVTARSRRNHFWFGTEKQAQFIPTPNSGADESPSGWDSGGALLNGGGFQLNSFGSHKEYVFEWPSSSSRQMAQLMRDYKNGSYGRGLVYFHDPLTFDTNVLPAMWADPSIGIGYEGSSLVYGLDPVSVPTSNRDMNHLPVVSAQYNLASIASGWRADDSLFIPIPEGFSLVIGAMYSFTGSGAVYYRTQTTSGVLGPLTTLPPVGNGDSDILNTIISGSGLAGIRIQVGRTSAVASTVTLTAMCARLIETSATISTVVATNVFTNPRCVAGGSTVEVRRNRAVNPRAAVDATGWGFNPGAGGTATGARVTGLTALGFPVDTGYRVTWSVAPTAVSEGAYLNDAPVTEGQAYSFAAYVYSTKAVTMRLRIDWRATIGGAPIGSSTLGPLISVPANTVTRLENLNAVAPATATVAAVVAYTGGSSALPDAGDEITVSAVLAEQQTTTPGPYFDGGYDSAPDPDLAPAWTGAVNGSASVLNGQAVTGFGQGAGRVIYRSTQFQPLPGYASVAIQRKGTATEAANGVTVKSGLVSADLNKPWTVIATVEIPAGYDASSDTANARSIYMLGNSVGRVQAPATPGVYELRATLTPTSVSQTIRLGGGGAVDQIVRWGNITIVDGAYDGPAFSGATPSDNYDYRWVGAVDNSASQKITRLVTLEALKKGPWLGGQGHSGCRFINNPTYIANTGVNGGQIGFSASFREVGSWVNG